MGEKMGKLPALQFYPGDEFRSNTFGLSLAARGLWFHMRLLMHDSERRGYLSMNGKSIPPGSIAQKCGCTLDQYLTLLGELDSASIPSRTTDGIIYDKAIIEQEKERQATAKRVRDYRDKLSNASCNAPVTGNVRVSSSSLSSSNKYKPPTPLKGEGFEEFFKEYPRHEARKPAYKAWLKINPDQDLRGKIMDELRKWKRSDQWKKDGGQFIPLPASWLNQERWTDELVKHIQLASPIPRPPVLDMVLPPPPTPEERAVGEKVREEFKKKMGIR